MSAGEPAAARRRAWWLPWLAVVAVLVVASALARDAIGIEWNVASAREFVTGLGWWAPAIFVLLVVFRIFLLIPSSVLLPVGGLCFGAPAATLYGAFGVTVSGMLKFGMVRWARRGAAFDARWQHRRRFVALTNTRTIALIVAFITSYPFGPAAAVHAGAGMTSIAFGAFAVALMVGAVVRAGTFSFFGSTVAEGEGIWLAGAVLLAVMGIPLLFPRTRAWLRGNV